VVRYVHLPGAAVDTALLEDATRRGRETLCLIFWIYLTRFLQKPLNKLQSLGDGAKDTADPEDFRGDYPKVVLIWRRRFSLPFAADSVVKASYPQSS